MEQVNNKVIFNLKEELLKYCIDDCKVLLKAVLIFRNLIIEKFDLDPWREAITIPSLAQKIYRYFFMPKHTIESFTDSKHRHSKIADK